MATQEKKDGKAYAFFQQPKPGEEAERRLFIELPDAKEMARLPPGMKVDLMRIDKLTGDPALKQVRDEARSYANTHVLEGTLPGETNLATARQVRDVIAHLSNAPGLWERKQPFVGGIVYPDEITGEYVMMETGF